MDSLYIRFEKICTEVATLKVKSGVWGAAGALIPIIGATIVWLLMK